MMWECVEIALCEKVDACPGETFPESTVPLPPDTLLVLVCVIHLLLASFLLLVNPSSLEGKHHLHLISRSKIIKYTFIKSVYRFI